MRFSQLFGQTLRDAPAEAETASHKLLTRAGYMRPLGAGQFAALQLGHRSLEKIAALARHRLNALGGQEIDLLTSAAPTPNDLSGLVGREAHSYKHLPRLLYTIQNQTAPAGQPLCGLLPARVSRMLTIFGLESSAEGQNRLSQALHPMLNDLLKQCGVNGLSAHTAPAGPHGNPAQSLFVAADAGETAVLACDACANAYAQFVAPFRRPHTPSEAPRSIEKVFTPHCKTIAELADFLQTPKSKTAKAILLMARSAPAQREQFVFALVRGDTDLSETKLAAALGATALRPATEEEIRAVGAVPGFASPVALAPSPKGRREDLIVVVDEAVAGTPNLVGGANEADYHLLNLNYGRDYTAQVVADIAAAPDDANCPNCAAPMRRFFATEIARVTNYGGQFNDSVACAFLDRDGKPRPVHMSTATLDLTRLLACAAEQNHDERGLALPIAIAPCQVHIVALKGGFEFAGQLCTDLTAAGVEVFFDDREESPGVKFNDADLIGLPIRLTVAEKSLAQGGVEFKLRQDAGRRVVACDQVVAEVIAAARVLESGPAASAALNPQ